MILSLCPLNVVLLLLGFSWKSRVTNNLALLIEGFVSETVTLVWVDKIKNSYSVAVFIKQYM